MALRQRIRSTKIQAWISDALLAQLDATARRLGVARAAVIRRALVAYLGASENGQPDNEPATPSA